VLPYTSSTVKRARWPIRCPAGRRTPLAPATMPVAIKTTQLALDPYHAFEAQPMSMDPVKNQ